MSDSKCANRCANWSSNGEANHATAYRAQQGIFGFGLISLFNRQWGTSFSVPAARGAGGRSALVKVARDAGGFEVVEMVCPSLGTRHGMFNVPRPSLASPPVIFPRQLRMAKVAVAARLAVNLIQLLFRESHVLQMFLCPWRTKPSSDHELLNPGNVCHAPRKKLRTTIADNRCPHRDLCRDSV